MPADGHTRLGASLLAVTVTLIVAATTTVATGGAAATTSIQCRRGVLVPNSLARSGHIFQPTGMAAEGVVRFTNVTSQDCVITSYPRVRLVTSHSTLRVAYSRSTLSRGERPVRRVRPGQTVLLRIWWENWCGSQPTAVTVGVGAGTIARLPLTGAPECASNGAPSRVAVTPFFRVVHAVG